MPNQSKQFIRWTVGLVALLTGALVQTGVCADANSALLDALIRKGILTEKEANDIQKESQTNLTSMSASKWKISDAVKSLGLFGDARFRYEYRTADNAPGISPSTFYRERFRYAFRAGIRGDLYDDFNYGFRIETSTNPRSPWVTFGDDSAPTPSAKNSDGIGIGQVYIGWHPTSWYEMTIGKMPMPLYTTPMIWDTDINPEGAFEKFKVSVPAADFFVGMGQFMYQDTNPDVAIPSSDTWLLAWQAGATVKFDKNVSFKIAPVVYNYAGHGKTAGLNLPFVGQGGPARSNPNTAALNQNGINDLLVVDVPGEFNLKLGNYHARVFGDFAYNINGDARSRAAWNANPAAFPSFPTAAPTGQNKAYQAGIGFGNEGPAYGPTQGLVYGSTSKKGTWEARAYWQHIEQYALDVNLIDSDFLEGRGNLEGFYVAVAYSVTDAIIATVRAGHGERIDKRLGTGGSNPDLPSLNPIANYNILQLDLTVRF